MPVDVLAICAHPDDAELTCAGTLLVAKAHGASIGVVDLSRGEMGSRGTVEERDAEAAAASEVLGLDVRVNLGLPDTAIEPTRENISKVVEIIRGHRPQMLLAPYWEDHHPDHAAASQIVKSAWWFAGVARYPGAGAPHRPELVMYYHARFSFTPSLVVDISDHFETKKRSVLCYKSQLYDPSGGGPETYLANPDFMAQWHARHRYMGSLIGVTYGEAYCLRAPVPVRTPLSLLTGRPKPI